MLSIACLTVEKKGEMLMIYRRRLKWTLKNRLLKLFWRTLGLVANGMRHKGIQTAEVEAVMHS